MRRINCLLAALAALSTGCTATVRFRVQHQGALARLGARTLSIASVDGPADSRAIVHQALEHAIISERPATEEPSAPWDSARDFVVDVAVIRSDARTESSLPAWQSLAIDRPGARCPGETRTSTAWLTASLTVRPVSGAAVARAPLTFASTGYGYLHRPPASCDGLGSVSYLANSIANTFADPTREQAFRQAANDIAERARRALWGWEQEASAVVLTCDDGGCAQAVALAQQRSLARAERLIRALVERLCTSEIRASPTRAEQCARARYDAALVVLLRGQPQESRTLALQAESCAHDRSTLEAIEELRINLGPSDARLIEAR